MVHRATHERTLQRRDGNIFCARCVVADEPWSRIRGLLGRRHLEDDEGILIRPSSAVHTFFMLFAVDVVFLDYDFQVVHVAQNVRPWRAVWRRGTAAIVEVAAGACAARGLAVGDRLEWATAA